ncbi:stalk domain-containing protein [Paenibacillus taichungensis]|uniref:stalk domain-containing protein n=1 Tax=Paenibacillus taichungensis TaxID=484184 RepID=UPI002DB70084|nr:stalk domain-containing protein [Paenibacillus taichungensis]MEC0110382.1 stalk domain-containing protein [Paenibacillus taichungensis]MEC0200058.1 stalk domain-containing protein [Paenibacillus taichungensis]
MKKKLLIATCSFLTVCLLVSAGIHAASKIQLIINDKEIYADIKVIKGTTYVPLRVISENLDDVTLNYDSAKNRITVNNNKHSVNTLTPSVSETGIALTRIELQNYLTKEFSKLDTSIGETTFTFVVEENDSIYYPYDFWIKVNYNVGFFLDVQSSVKMSEENRLKVKSELKGHMEKIAKTAIGLMPGKKIQGNYHYEFYRYPIIKEDLVMYKYYSWKNYSGEGTSYKANVLSNFIWSNADISSL